MCFQMSPQIVCTRGHIIARVTFVWLFFTVCFQMSPQISCLVGYKITLFAFVPQMACPRGCIVKLVAFVDFSTLCVIKCIIKLHELLCSSKYCDWIHWPCSQHWPRAHIKHRQFIKKNIIVGVGNPDDWWTQDCPPVGNSEVGNPEGNQLDLLIFVDNFRPVSDLDSALKAFKASTMASRWRKNRRGVDDH